MPVHIRRQVVFATRMPRRMDTSARSFNSFHCWDIHATTNGGVEADGGRRKQRPVLDSAEERLVAKQIILIVRVRGTGDDRTTSMVGYAKRPNKRTILRAGIAPMIRHEVWVSV